MYMSCLQPSYIPMLFAQADEFTHWIEWVLQQQERYLASLFLLPLQRLMRNPLLLIH